MSLDVSQRPFETPVHGAEFRDMPGESGNPMTTPRKGSGGLSGRYSRALELANTEASREKRKATMAQKRRLLNEDILLLWGRGLVPLAIAKRLRVSVDRIGSVVREAGFEIPSYMTSSGPRPEEDSCPHCGRPF